MVKNENSVKTQIQAKESILLNSQQPTQQTPQLPN